MQAPHVRGEGLGVERDARLVRKQGWDARVARRRAVNRLAGELRGTGLQVKTTTTVVSGQRVGHGFIGGPWGRSLQRGNK